METHTVLPPNVSLACKTRSKTFGHKTDHQAHVRRNHRNLELSCVHCSYSTKFRRLLIIHLRNCESKLGQNSKFNSLKCPMCDFCCKNRSVMTKHYIDEHNVEINVKHLEFADLSAFEDWRSQIEASECFRFIHQYSSREKGRIVKKYRCFKDVVFTAKVEEKEKTQHWSQNKVCPCSVKIEVLKGAVKASYVPCHVGHASDISTVRQANPEPAGDVSSTGGVVCPQTSADHVKAPSTRSKLELAKAALYREFSTIIQSAGSMEELDIVQKAVEQFLHRTEAVSRARVVISGDLEAV